MELDCNIFPSILVLLKLISVCRSISCAFGNIASTKKKKSVSSMDAVEDSEIAKSMIPTIRMMR